MCFIQQKIGLKLKDRRCFLLNFSVKENKLRRKTILKVYQVNYYQSLQMFKAVYMLSKRKGRTLYKMNMRKRIISYYT